MAATENHIVQLTPDVAAIAQRAVNNGSFASVSDFVEQAVYTWKEAQPLDAEEVEYLKAKVQESLDLGGPYLTMEEVFDPLLAKLQALVDAQESDAK